MEKISSFTLWMVLLQFCQVSYASSKPLDELLAQAKFYYRLGRQNNSIAYKVMQKSTGTLGKEISVIREKKALTKAISDCVFFDKGASGVNLSEVSQKILSYRLYDFMRVKGSLRKARYYRVDDPSGFIASGISRAKCVLAVELGESRMLMQGVANLPNIMGRHTRMGRRRTRN